MEEARGPTEIDVWPDCWDAVMVFAAMGTQWRVGPAGPYGLDYSAIPPVMAMLGLSGKQIFEDVRTMETVALKML